MATYAFILLAVEGGDSLGRVSQGFVLEQHILKARCSSAKENNKHMKFHSRMHLVFNKSKILLVNLTT